MGIGRHDQADDYFERLAAVLLLSTPSVLSQALARGSSREEIKQLLNELGFDTVIDPILELIDSPEELGALFDAAGYSHNRFLRDGYGDPPCPGRAASKRLVELLRAGGSLSDEERGELKFGKRS